MPKLEKLAAKPLSQPVTEAINMSIKQSNFSNNAKTTPVAPLDKGKNQINMFQILDQSASGILFQRFTNKLLKNKLY